MSGFLYSFTIIHFWISPLLLLISLAVMFRIWKKTRNLRIRFATVISADEELASVRQKTDDEKCRYNELRIRFDDLERRYGGVLDAEAEVAKLKATAGELRSQILILKDEYKAKKSTYDRLTSEVAVYDQKIAFAELGVYAPHFEFSDSEAYKRAIENVRDRQKILILQKNAVTCAAHWAVNGDERKGKAMTEKNMKLILRAFNSECDAAIANTRWNNVNAMEKRINKAREQIDRLSAENKISITDQFLSLKLEELFLTHEHREKIREEREEKAETARIAREEKKLQRELEDAEADERHYQKLLTNARQEAEMISGPKMLAFQQQIQMLEEDLARAKERAERAQAMAEKTRSGYIYIISNIGSFGPDIVKIGLTRRLDPLERIQELGDASVPFIFDIHAMIYSDDAPSLERALHAEFEATRVNSENVRKEFFRTSLEDVESAVKRLAPTAAFFKDIEAQQYRETVARRDAALRVKTAAPEERFPVSV